MFSLCGSFDMDYCYTPFIRRTYNPHYPGALLTQITLPDNQLECLYVKGTPCPK